MVLILSFWDDFHCVFIVIIWYTFFLASRSGILGPNLSRFL